MRRCCTTSRVHRTGPTPESGVIRDPEGNLYGTTLNGGTNNAGVVYKVDRPVLETVLYNFTAWTGTTIFPNRSDPRLYRLPLRNHVRKAAHANDGVVFKLDTAGQYTVLHNFTGNDGGEPRALSRDAPATCTGLRAACYSSWIRLASTGSCTPSPAAPMGVALKP